MIWAQKVAPPHTDLSSLQDQFDELFTSLGTPSPMMLVLAQIHPMSPKRIVMLLPDESLLSRFEGFRELTDHANLPTVAALLVGRMCDFEERFDYASVTL
jgi:hypothetical protein